jgi:hypothetical protein
MSNISNIAQNISDALEKVRPNFQFSKELIVVILYNMPGSIHLTLEKVIEIYVDGSSKIKDPIEFYQAFLPQIPIEEAIGYQLELFKNYKDE